MLSSPYIQNYRILKLGKEFTLHGQKFFFICTLVLWQAFDFCRDLFNSFVANWWVQANDGLSRHVSGNANMEKQQSVNLEGLFDVLLQ
jgi:hypothetical protein